MPSSSVEHNHGKIQRLYADEGGLYLRLTGGQTDMNPQNGYYRLLLSTHNYQSMFSLILLAAETNRAVKLRTQDTLTGGFAIVVYVVVDW